ncbi:tagaturonate reductase [Thiospirochaeta perfilievii]|nr:tagaturonate reductase [Thiospirochaeta perfilievii]
MELNKKNLGTIIGREKDEYPVKVLQFGEGNFLRGFVDWMIHRTNQKGLFNGSVRVVQPLENGLITMLNDQNGLYTLIRRGLFKGEVINDNEIITSIERGINPYTEYDDFIQSADLPELRFVVSNTTEAGIVYRGGESIDDKPQISYPGKLTAFLYRRFKTFNKSIDKGLIIIPCELIDRNGDNLKKIVYRLANEWILDKEFIQWLDNSCAFFNTLVDRIVTGYPRNEVEDLTKELGYKDNLLDSSEVFNLWVIEGDKKYSAELPLAETDGCNVIWTEDMTPYRTRKVRILNGIHTMMCLPAYLYGVETVGECLENKTVRRFIDKAVETEIIPSINFDKKELTEFAKDVMERFANPFIKHELLSISLNSVSKYKARVLPTVLEYIELNKKAPELLSFSLASLMHFYKEHGKDSSEVLEYFNRAYKDFNGTKESGEIFTKNIMSNLDFWGQDLALIKLFYKKVTHYFNEIESKGIKSVMESL